MVPEWIHCIYYGSMTSLHIRDMPTDALRTLKARAARSGQSLQAYARALLVEEATLLSPEESLAAARDLAAHSAVTEDDIMNALESSRRARGA